MVHMMADSLGWKVILAYVCFALGAALLLFGFVRLAYFCVKHRQDKKREEQYFRNLRQKFQSSLALDSDGKLIRNPINIQLDGAAIYAQPGGPRVNPAVLYEDANPPKLPQRLYREGEGGDGPYETIEQTMIIDQSGTATPASIQSSSHPQSSRSEGEGEAAIGALDGATAEEDPKTTKNTPRSVSDKDSVYMVTGDGETSVMQLPRTSSVLSGGDGTFRYRTYSHEPLPIHKEIEHDYTFVTSFH